MPRSEAQKRAAKKYQASGKCRDAMVAASLRKPEKAALQSYASAVGVTLSQFAKLAMRYCAENNIDLTPHIDKPFVFPAPENQRDA